MRRPALVAALLIAAAARADLTPGAWRVARTITTPSLFGDQQVYVPLDDAALTGTTAHEFRIVGAGNREVPYRTVREDGEPIRWPIAAHIVAVSPPESAPQEIVAETAGGSGCPLRLELQWAEPSASFVSQVRIYGSDDRRHWHALRTVSRLIGPAAPGAATMFIDLPAGKARFLRVLASHPSGRTLALRQISLEGAMPVPRRLVLLPASLTRETDHAQRRTQLLLDQGRRVQGLAEVRLSIAEGAYDRPVEVAISDDGAVYSPVAGFPGARLHRVTGAADAVGSLDDVTARLVRVAIADGDDAPLTLRKAALSRYGRGLIFQARAGERYTLWYGNPRAAEPAYEIARLPIAKSPDRMPQCHLEPERRLPAPPTPWTRRHPWFLWEALIGVVGFLLLVIVRAMKSMKTPESSDGTSPRPTRNPH